MKNIFVGYERGSGISPYFAGAQARGLSFPLFKNPKLSHRLIMLAIKLYQLHIRLFYRMLLGDWTKNLANVSAIIFTANREVLPALDFLQRNYPQIKLHIFYLNTLDTEAVDLAEWSKAHCKIWTFDKNDSETFTLRLTTQPICKESFDAISDKKTRYDVVFVGEDKKRLPILLDLQRSLEAQKLAVNFQITCNYFPNRTPGFDYTYAKILTYEQVLQLYAQSKAVVEILQAGQRSSTMRALEAGYLGKKLITNNPEIISEPYYHPNNIFILNETNASQISDFLQKDFVQNFDYNYYEMEQWLARLEIEK